MGVIVFSGCLPVNHLDDSTVTDEVAIAIAATATTIALLLSSSRTALDIFGDT